MKQNELPDYTAYLIIEYYKNNIQPFLNAFADDCLWIGPAEGQMIRTKEALLAAFAEEVHQLTFDMQNLHIIPLSVSTGSMDVVLTYTIITYYPDRETISFNQRLEMLWVEENSEDFRIRLCHISNEFPYDTRDNIYPNHFTALDISKIYTGKMSLCKFALKGLYNSYFYLSGDTIMWMESKDSHTLIHTTNKIYESVETLTAITQKYSDTFYKIHASYSVNPTFVSAIGRFYVQMDDGKILSIPEKKYTKTREELNHRITPPHKK